MPPNEAHGAGPEREPDEGLEQSFQELAGLLFSGMDVNETLQKVAALAQRAIPGCDAGSITVVDGGRPHTAASTAELAERVDDHQYATGEGPCLECIRQQATVPVDSYRGLERWPRFVPQARSHGVASSLSLPLFAGDEVIGALNLYAVEEHGFTGAEPVGEAFARQAAITLANATAYYRAAELAQHLAVALEHRDVIGQAKGVLMVAQGVAADEAFDMLRRASQRSNRKLYDVARDIVERPSSGGRSSP